MPSFKSKMFVFMLKNRHLMKGQLKRKPMVDWNTSMPKLREQIERESGFLGKLPEDFKLSPVNIDGLSAEWMVPPASPKDKVILYFHGGGYAIGSVKAHRGIVAKFVKGTGTSALVFDYRLAPENPYPGALDDAVAAHKWLLAEGYRPSNIIFIGDSAGAGLCLATLLALRDQGIALPVAAVAQSPWTDLTNSGESWITKRNVDTLTWPDSQEVFSKYYAGDNDPVNPLISPLFGDLHGMPPMLIFVGGDELLLSDSTRYAEKAKAAGVDVTLRIGEGMFHCYPACAPLFPEATEAMAEICEFVKKQLKL